MDLVARAWKRYGHDRTYFEDSLGVTIGWLDNATGEVHAETSEREATIRAHIAATAEVGATYEAEPHDDLHVPEPGWTDLAERQPGQAARERATSELEVMRGRSKLVTGVLRLLDAKTDERAWRIGADGEETVGAKLEKLQSLGWHVLHSVPVGDRGSDIDHVVIGTGGVFTINVKNHPGKRVWVSSKQIRVDGKPVPYLRNSEFEAQRAAKCLCAVLGWQPPVSAALVFLTRSLMPDVKIVEVPKRVHIWDRMDVNFQLKRQPLVLTSHQVAEVFEVARRSTTWV